MLHHSNHHQNFQLSFILNCIPSFFFLYYYYYYLLLLFFYFYFILLWLFYYFVLYIIIIIIIIVCVPITNDDAKHGRDEGPGHTICKPLQQRI